MLSALDPATLFKPLAGVRHLLLAVSGGPDSLALMHLARLWRGETQLSVATVDHGLREGARAEAEQVAQCAAAMGLPHHLLVWEGEKPAARIQERARAARYALLGECAKRIGAEAIATAHHADDQAETILLRLARGSGVAGLAGMGLHSLRGGLEIWRPLLGVPKAALVAFCQERGQPFFEDPSNANPLFARTRVRALARTLAEQGLDRDGLLRLGRRAARAEAALAGACDEFCARWDGADAPALATLADEIALRVLARQLASDVRLERLERLWARLRPAIAASRPFAATLGGRTLRLDARRRLEIAPEPARRRGATPPCAPSA